MVAMPETEEIIGIFIGLSSSSYEYIANIIAPYKTNFSIELGNFLLIHDAPNKLVARVIDFVPQGELTSFMGQKWLSDVAFESEAIGSDIKKRKITYSVKIKMLGCLDEKNKFSPGLKRIPHITSKVVKPDSDVVKQIVHIALEEQEGGTEIGDYYLDRSIKVRFNLNELDSKRTFIFARAGYGKSNLMKLLASAWKEEFGSLVIFDPDGEYAFTDKKLRPGILDKKEAILVTNRRENEGVGNVYRKLKINLKEFDAGFLVPILVPPEKHDNIFFQKLMGLEPEEWRRLVDLLYQKGWKTPLDEIKEIVIGSDSKDESKDLKPILNNLVYPISRLHDPESHLISIIENAMKNCIVIIFDVSRVDSKTRLWLSSIIVKRVFSYNQKNFIQGSTENLIKATFAIDEAQSVLSKESNVEAFVELAKEGRKYQLGGIFITQQPLSIPLEILSQADNFFVFHLLSRGDLDALQRANAHYSNDIITQILNEPIKGKCYMWTSSQPFVLPVQVSLFEDESIINKSKEVQEKSKLLSDIQKEIDEELKSPVFQSILKKFTDVEKENAGEEVSVKTLALFKKLDDTEKDFIRKKDGLQVYDGKEFAIKFPYYRQLEFLEPTIRVT